MKLVYGEEVQTARNAGRPIVALETTVITHGMDYPDNVDTALAMEVAVREAGACPATLGIVNGEITIGLSTDQIKQFGTAEKDSIAKCSRRDLPSLLASGSNGSLTVAGTMMVAHMAGIDVMATGGIGGVHRGHPYDVSADLMELGRTPVTVVCAGAKSILDLKLTMEVLETQGVPVIGYGTSKLPAFYSQDSGIDVPHRVDSIAAAASLLTVWRNLDAGNGMLLTVPVPGEAALGNEEAEQAIEQAVREADEAGVTGSAVTPFILARVVDLTQGRSLEANRSLLENNARTAAQAVVAAAD